MDDIDDWFDGFFWGMIFSDLFDGIGSSSSGGKFPWLAFFILVVVIALFVFMVIG